MDLKKRIGFLQESMEFKDWKAKNKDNFISYALFITGEKDDTLQIGYYNRKSDKVTTFDISADDKDKGVSIKPEESVFKKLDMKIEAISMDDVEVSISDVLSECQRLQKEKYPSETPVKIIMILQRLSPYGQVFNVTYVTKCFKTLNIKIDCGTGEIVHEELVSLMQFPSK